MRFWLGLVIGMLAGGGGVYLALERPWQGLGGDPVVASADAGADARLPERDRNKRRRPGKRQPRAEGDEIPTLDAADRQLSWKGDLVKLPEARIDFASDSEGRPLSDSEIDSVIQSHSDAALACIVEARGNAPLAAEILFEMLIDPGGRVDKVRVRAPAYLFAQGFYPCARRAARAWRFPATGAYTVARAPFDLR